MPRSSNPTRSELIDFISRFVEDELAQRFEGRKLSDISDHEIVDILTKLLHGMPTEDEWRWARRNGKKLGVTASELLTMRWSQANALAVKRGVAWAITPKKPRAGVRASGSRGASRRKPAPADPRE